MSQAATPTASIEPEHGTLAGAAVVNTAGASGGQAVKFGAGTVPPSGNFSISNAKIFDPDGHEFIPIGANVNGPNSWWSGQTAGFSTQAKDRWHWNTLRLNSCLSGGCPDAGSTWTVNNNLDAIVSEYTAKKIVVMIEIHNFTGNYPNSSELATLTTYWQAQANKYKNNPYVWFNLLNEPGGDPEGTSLNTWASVHDTLATAIRATGAQNMIVIDGSSWAQESYDWECTPTFDINNSGIYTKGQALVAEHGNVTFALHVYGWWGAAGNPCPGSTIDARITWYVNQLRSKGLTIHVGEFQGVSNLSLVPWYQAGQTAAAEAFFRTAPGLGLGLIYWTGSAGSTQTSGLLANDSDWSNINASASNLSTWGTQLRNYGLTLNP